MKAILRNLTDIPVTLDGETVSPASRPLVCTDALPAPVAGSYFLVPACLAPAAHTRADIVWSAGIAQCGGCALPPSKRGWLAKPRHRQVKPRTLLVVDHYTPEAGRQGVGMEFFRQRYLQ